MSRIILDELEARRDREHAALVRLEMRSQALRRAGVESELAEAGVAGDAELARIVRVEIGRCDRALMELAAGRLPTVRR